jgi:hypothetical protein
LDADRRANLLIYLDLSGQVFGGNPQLKLNTSEPVNHGSPLTATHFCNKIGTNRTRVSLKPGAMVNAMGDPRWSVIF